MRHQKAGLHLSRTPAHRKALFSNLVAALFTHERIRTTDAKAKETRRLAERTITWARRLGDVLTKKADARTPEESARVVHAVRMARRVVRDRIAVVKLFDEIGPRYLGRPGGYTRIMKIGARPGDAAPMSLLELVPDGEPQVEATEAPAETKGKGKEPSGKAPKAEKSAKGEKADKSAKAEKPAKGEKAEKTAAKPKAKAKGKSEE
jgi:large subunit ribosomal protein L17